MRTTAAIFDALRRFSSTLKLALFQRTGMSEPQAISEHLAHKPQMRTTLAIAAAWLGLNLAHQIGWAIGLPISAWFYLLPLIALLLLAAKARWHGLLMTALFVVPLIIILSGPVADWDARSIWFFHAKRIYFEGYLYAQLDGYPGFSHNDYPILVPALAASIAHSAGYWNEVLPRLSVLCALLPIALVFANLLASRAVFNLFAAVTLLIGGGMLFNGYMDAILALYFAAGCLLILHLREHPSDRAMLLVFALVLAHLLLLKNEGLVAALLLTICAAPLLGRLPMAAPTLGLPWAFYVLIWRWPLLKADIKGDLMTDDLTQRLLSSLLDFDTLFMVLGEVYAQAGIALIALAALQNKARRYFWVLLPVLLYIGVLIAVYLSTPHSVDWHLATSASRTLLPVTLAIVAILAYSLDRPREPLMPRPLKPQH